MLTVEQRQSFSENGWVVVPDLLTADELAKLRTATELDEVQLAQRALGGEGELVHNLQITIEVPVFWQLAEHSRILDCVESLIGPNIQVHHSKYATKPPTDAEAGSIRWHQDFPYFVHTNTDLVAAFVYLDDATADNGCMQMIRGSHKRGQLNHADEEGIFTRACTVSDVWADQSKIVNVEASAGSISIHHCMVVHASDVNRSGRNRRGLIYQYRAADSALIGGVTAPDTGRLVRGSFDGRVRCDGSYVLPRFPGATQKDHGSWGTYDTINPAARGTLVAS